MRFADCCRGLVVDRVVPRLCAVALIACAGCASVETPPPASSATVSPMPPPTPASDSTVPAAPIAVPPNVQRDFDAARRALAAKQFDEAERGFLALTKAHPEFGGPFVNLAIVYRQAGKHAESIAALERAVQVNPQQPVYYNQLGIAHRHAGQFAKARDAYEKAITIDANYAAAILNLGILHDIYLRDGARALALYERYLALTPAGDDDVKKWISDLKNRAAAKTTAARKEQQ